jgi:rubrerythrin
MHLQGNPRPTENTWLLAKKQSVRGTHRLPNFETVHAHAHLRTLKGIRSTVENLQEAISGETHEFKTMYPAMIEEAKAEDESAALRSFSYANEVEKVHADLYQKALDNLDNVEEVDYWVCSVCGYTCEKDAPDVCPVCDAKAKVFFKVD